MKCKACGIEYKQLAAHLRNYHDNMTQKEYYDLYYKKPNEGICRVCQKPTKFHGFAVGYSGYCGKKCANIDPATREKIRQNSLKKYGTEHPNQSKKVQDKIKQTNLERYGVESILQLDKTREASKKSIWTEETRAKRTETNLKRYGAANPAQSKKVQDKMKSTNLKRYGSENLFSSDYGKEKIKETNLKYYGAENPMSAGTNIRNKVEKKIRKTHGGMGAASTSIQEKMQQTRQENIKKFEQENNCTAVKNLNIDFASVIVYKSGVKTFTHKSIIYVYNKDIQTIEEYAKKLAKVDKGTIPEREIQTFIKSFYDKDYLLRTKKIIPPLELDFYFPKEKLAIEFNGSYWHSTNNGLEKDYHLNKTKRCEELGIRLIHIFEWEWNNKQDICKSIISSALGVFENRIYARNCMIKEVPSKEANEFLETNHIQGKINSSYKLGLYYNNELVQIITIGKSRFQKDAYELLRSCTKLNTQVIGGFSKLIKAQPYNHLISYVDRAKFNGSSYNIFTFIGESQPSYHYYLGDIRINRLAAQKHKLPKLLTNFDPRKTEAQNMIDNNWLQVYDCGTLKFELVKEKYIDNKTELYNFKI